MDTNSCQFPEFATFHLQALRQRWVGKGKGLARIRDKIIFAAERSFSGECQNAGDEVRAGIVQNAHLR